MQMLYNSDSYAVVRFDVPAETGSGHDPGVDAAEGGATGRGGYEIVDKFARKEIFLEGALALTFKQGVDRIIETGPTEEALDEFIAGFTQLANQPLVLH